MTQMNILKLRDPTETDLDPIREGMKRHTMLHCPWEEYEPLKYFCKSDDGQTIAAAIGECGRGWLHLSVIWVHEEHRAKGLGSRLLNEIETAAMDLGAHGSYLDTFSYQAPEFYRKQGYRVLGELANYPPGHSRFFMQKELNQNQSC